MLALYAGQCLKCKAFFPAGTPINYVRGAGASHIDCGAAKAAREVVLAQAPQLNLTSIALFLTNASQKLKTPKLRVMSDDDKSELLIKFTKRGDLAVLENGEFIGCIRSGNGDVTRDLVNRPTLRIHLNLVNHDPVAAAKSFAALTGRCAFCGLILTDEGSVEAGYGPICARNWRLPHTAKGTKALTPVPQPIDGAAILREVEEDRENA